MRPLAAPTDAVRSGCPDLATTSPLLTLPSGHRVSSQVDVAGMASTSATTVVEGLRQRCAHRLRPVCAAKFLHSHLHTTDSATTVPGDFTFRDSFLLRGPTDALVVRLCQIALSSPGRSSSLPSSQILIPVSYPPPISLKWCLGLSNMVLSSSPSTIGSSTASISYTAVNVSLVSLFRFLGSSSIYFLV